MVHVQGLQVLGPSAKLEELVEFLSPELQRGKKGNG